MKLIMQLIASPNFAIYLANLALTVTLICAAGLLAIAILRKKSAMLRHALLVSALILTLLAPVLVWLTCHNGFGLIHITSTQKSTAQPLPVISKDNPTSSDFSQEMPTNRVADNRPIQSYTDITKKKDASAIAPTQSVNMSDRIPKPVVDSPQIAWHTRTVVMGIVSTIWLLGMIVTAVWYVRGYVILRLFRQSLESSATGLIESAAHEAATMLGLQSLPPIMVSAYAPAPLSLGLLHPLIVLPKNLTNEIDARQLRAVLIHETAHLVHRHHWIGLGQFAAGIMFWWNPLLHKINRGIMQLREEICDDHVLQSQNDGQDFAKVLIQLATKIADLPKVPSTIAIIDTGLTDMGQRIARLLDTERVIVIQLNRKATAVILSFIFVLTITIPLASLRAEHESVTKTADTIVESNPPAIQDKAESKTISTDQHLLPVSISAAEFSRLTASDQRDLLVRIFQRRLEHAKNIYYETDRISRSYENRDGVPGKLSDKSPVSRSKYGHWRLGDSFRMDTYNYKNLNSADYWIFSSSGVNAEEGIGRSTQIITDEKRQPTAQVLYPFEPQSSDGYNYWLNGKNSRENNMLGEYIFPYLLDHKEQFDIKAPAVGDKVQLSVPWQPWWTDKPGGKRTYILDPQKRISTN